MEKRKTLEQFPAFPQLRLRRSYAQVRRMTTLYGGCNIAGWICKKHGRSKKSQALPMNKNVPADRSRG
jgi:hypothetical protein